MADRPNDSPSHFESQQTWAFATRDLHSDDRSLTDD